MKTFVNLIFGGLIIGSSHVAMALEEYNINYGVTYSDDITVHEDSVRIINHGTMAGNTVTLDNGRELWIQNYGYINSDFVCNNATQYISGAVNEYGNNDIQQINGLAGHKIMVYNGNDDHIIIDMADLIRVAQNANELHLGNATFTIGDNVPEFSHTIQIDDESVYFVITEIPSDLSKPLISNVSHPNIIHVDFDGIDPMFRPEKEWKNINDLYVNVIRETDYSVVFGGALGDYLDGLRDKNPNDKLLTALDSQMNRDGLNHVLSHAGRTNPINLMHPIIQFNTHDSMLFLPGTAIAPFYMFSNDFYMIGGHINIGGEIADNWYGGIGLVGGVINYSSDFDDFSGMLYGINLGAQYIDDSYYINTYGDFLYTTIDDADVFHNDKIIHNPDGFGMNFVSDFGLVYKVYDDLNLNLIPFIGARTDYISIVGENDYDFNLRIGAKAEKTDNTDGNKYAIGGKLLIQTDATVYGGFYIDMLSVADGVGGGLEIGAAYDDFGMSYKFALGGKVIF